MAKRTLVLKNLAGAPFADFIQAEITKHLAPLTDAGILEIDFTGRKKGIYEMAFDPRYSWSSVNVERCWRIPGLLGETTVVWLEAHKRMNYCTNVRDCRTCFVVFKHSKDELGTAIANTALHELGHQFGLNSKTAFSGATDAGHTGDERNFMFDVTVHPDWKPILADTNHTTKRTIRAGDTLSEIAHQVGFRRWARVQVPWKTLYEFKGQDGRSNRELLRSGDPDRIFPGEQIWVPDYVARRKKRVALEVVPKTFTKPQVESMKRWVDEGRQFMSVQ